MTPLITWQCEVIIRWADRRRFDWFVVRERHPDFGVFEWVVFAHPRRDGGVFLDRLALHRRPAGRGTHYLAFPN